MAMLSELIPTAPLLLTINGQQRSLNLAPWTTLLDALREYAHLPGTKKGCDHGQCGACTVLVDGKRINACLTLAIMHQDHAITTIEGLADATATVAPGERSAPRLHPMQQACIDHDAFQCGYCTPGQICSAVGMLNEGHVKTEADIRELMSGNICRCGAYPHIVNAIRDVMNLDQTA